MVAESFLEMTKLPPNYEFMGWTAVPLCSQGDLRERYIEKTLGLVHFNGSFSMSIFLEEAF